ncbi:MAG: MBL fold metallo-hydrolase [Candidatus Thioglobus sp.]|nr:MBL fold metallo-hydrolase [Candidatus Thioglobus pontius]MBL6984552.1 MBL fold metallo-hydrolase [Candidatus Thioglobus sp.]
MKLQTFDEKTYHLDIMYHQGVYENSIHFIFDHESKTCAIVDPAWHGDLFIEYAQKKGYVITDIWLTHWHGDHTNAADEIAEKTGAKITVGINELPYLDIEHDLTTVNDGDTIALGATTATVINTPGHTAGGVCYLLDGHIIVGDTLFVYGAGHCSMPGGSVHEFYHSMQKLKTINDDVMLHCGHDYGCKINTTMGEQKSGNAYLLLDNERDFVRFVEGMSQGLVAYPTEALSLKEVQAML